MCLGIPGRIVEVHDEHGVTMGTVDFGGVRRAVCLAYVADEIAAGDFAIIHVGFAISRLDEEEALKTLEILGGMGVLEPELMTMGPDMDQPAGVSDDAPGALTLDPAPPPSTMAGPLS